MIAQISLVEQQNQVLKNEKAKLELDLALQIEENFQKCKGLESEIERLKLNLEQTQVLF